MFKGVRSKKSEARNQESDVRSQKKTTLIKNQRYLSILITTKAKTGSCGNYGQKNFKCKRNNYLELRILKKRKFVCDPILKFVVINSRRGILVVSCQLLVVDCWLLVVGCQLLVVDCWLLVVGCWLLAPIQNIELRKEETLRYNGKRITRMKRIFTDLEH